MRIRQIIGLHILSGLAGMLSGLACAEGAPTTLEVADRATSISVPAQPIETALNEFARQSGVHVVIDSRIAGGVMSAPVQGTVKTEEGLALLLKGTGLTYRVLDGQTVSVERVVERATFREEGKAEVRLAQAQAEGASGAGQGSEVSQEATADSGEGAKLEEIVVTAQKRVERLQDVPVPVTAINADELVESNLLRIEDYYTRIPGLNSAPGTQASNLLSIRGITTAGTNPTVGVVIDDVPFGGSTGFGGGFVVPDIDPSELTRIEVLRGPQGTLYGASSMGGLFKFVTVDPSTAALSGRLQGGVSSIRNGDDVGYNVRGAVNVPLSDTLAVRASAFTRRDPGYIDDPGLGIESVNEGQVSGGRLSALWRPSNMWSLKLSALFQDSEADASSDVFPTLGEFEQSYALPGLGGYDREAQAYSAILTGELGRFDLVALSGYNVNTALSSLDFTPFIGVPTPYISDLETTKFNQEVRLSTSISQRVDWLVGAFYTDENTDWIQRLLTTDPDTGEVNGEIVNLDIPTGFEEYALFTNFTFHVTDRFDLQVGGRQSQNRQTFAETWSNGAIVVPEIRTKENAFTYLVTPQFKVSPDFMVYARLASGYRAGGPNTRPAPQVPVEYDPDTTENYEIGVKGTALDRMLSFDASVYYIDWKDIQLVFVTPNGGFNANGSRAKSQGVELSVELRPLTGMTLAAWTAWNEAELTEDLPPEAVAAGKSGGPGDRLPFSSRFSGNVSVEQDFSLAGSATGFAGASLSYVGDRLTYLRAAGSPRQTLPSYTKADLRAGVEYEEWTITAFVNNVTDKRGALAGGFDSFNPLAFTYIQPRTIGLSVTRVF